MIAGALLDLIDQGFQIGQLLGDVLGHLHLLEVGHSGVQDRYRRSQTLLS